MTMTEHAPISASENEQSILRKIDSILENSNRSPMLVGADGEQILLPASLFQVLKRTVSHLSRGQAVTIIPINKEVTTQEAADILNVSRPYLIKMLEEEKIPYITVGAHRRIPLHTLLEYKERRDDEREQALRELTQLSQELGLYDE
jgi:excisionase family DNA binding protein